MNTYYLKKFRKEAQRVIKARYNPITLDTKYPYDCTQNKSYISESMSKDLPELKRKLLEYRRDYILALVEIVKGKKLNKQLAKL